MSLELWQGREKPTVGTLVAVRFSEDGLVYRAKVTRIENQFNSRPQFRLYLLETHYSLFVSSTMAILSKKP